MTRSRIGWGQTAIVLALARIFSEAANFPSDDINYGMQRFTVIVLSYLLLGVTLVPLYIAMERNGGAVYKSRTGAVAASLYLILAGITTATRLQFYSSSTVLSAAPPWVIILFVSLVCLYGIFKGVPATLRTGVITAAGFLVLLITVIIGVSREIRPDYLYPALAERPSALLTEVLTEYSKNAEAVIFASLCPMIRTRRRRSLLLALGLSLAALLLMTFLYNTVLGEYLNVTNFPFYALSSLSDISVLQRLDGIDVTVWTMTAVIKLTLIMLSVYVLAENAFNSRKTAYISACSALGITTLAAFFFSVNTNDFLRFSAVMETGIPLAVAAAAVPLSELIISGKRSHNEKIIKSS
ncbi:MAG: GerAB/ArcD/ProY family transporter [Ruminiclostridium sp.]|nr:GerAB/ArcD/ProY family transporter [Ruminiclostridium sp.]